VPHAPPISSSLFWSWLSGNIFKHDIACKQQSVFTLTPHLSTDTDSTNISASVYAARHIFLLAYLHKSSSTAFTLTRWKIITSYSAGRSLRSSELLVRRSCQFLIFHTKRLKATQRISRTLLQSKLRAQGDRYVVCLADLQQVSHSVDGGSRETHADHCALLWRKFLRPPSIATRLITDIDVPVYRLVP
jgi:hypothetical protein